MRLLSYSPFFLSVLAHAASASAGSIDLPSTAPEAAQFFLTNQSGREVVFYLETESSEKTEMRLMPGEGSLYSGEPGEAWMNVYIYTEGHAPVEKYMDTGKRYYLQSTDSGGIDMFMLPPR